jgi:hypothetical protein
MSVPEKVHEQIDQPTSVFTSASEAVQPDAQFHYLSMMSQLDIDPLGCALPHEELTVVGFCVLAQGLVKVITHSTCPLAPELLLSSGG